MAKLTKRDHVWSAALEYVQKWEKKELHEKRNRYGFTVEELTDWRDLDASEKTIRDTLESMAELGWLRSVGGSGGEPSCYSR